MLDWLQVASKVVLSEENCFGWSDSSKLTVWVANSQKVHSKLTVWVIMWVLCEVTECPQNELSVSFNVSSQWFSYELQFFTGKAHQWEFQPWWTITKRPSSTQASPAQIEGVSVYSPCLFDKQGNCCPCKANLSTTNITLTETKLIWDNKTNWQQLYVVV